MDEHDKKIIAQFTAQSKHFNSSEYSVSSREYLEWAVDKMPLDISMRVLDVAAGTGHLSLAVSPRVKSVAAVDITEAMLEEGRRAAAKRGITNVAFKLGSAYDLSAERGFDMAMSRLAFHHLSRPGDVLWQMAKAVKPGGSVVVLDIVSPEEPEPADVYNHLETLRDDSHVRALTKGELTQMFRDMGLGCINVFTRSVINSLEAWMNMTDTPPDKRAIISEAVLAELKGGGSTGLSPFTDDSGAVRFIHRWVLITARTPSL